MTPYATHHRLQAALIYASICSVLRYRRAIEQLKWRLLAAHQASVMITFMEKSWKSLQLLSTPSQTKCSMSLNTHTVFSAKQLLSQDPS